jgi:arsenate reductase
MMIYRQIEALIEHYSSYCPSVNRLETLLSLIHYGKECIKTDEPLVMQFICTHNSRRSQLAQVWAQVAAAYYHVPLVSLSGGVEVTAFNERAAAALERQGFALLKSAGINPKYSVRFSDHAPEIMVFSKLFDDPYNAHDRFVAVMTCAEADQDCPFIPNAALRAPLRYDDPKIFDETPEETAQYDRTAELIANEMCFLFKSMQNLE